MAYQEVPIPAPGGTLKLCMLFADDPDGRVTAGPVHGLGFEYTGRLPREMGLELVRQTPEDQQITVNGRPLLEFLESL